MSLIMFLNSFHDTHYTAKSIVNIITSYCCRTNLLGIDLNRAWHKISQWVHPILYAVYNHLTEIEKNEVGVTRIVAQNMRSVSA